MLKVNEGPVDRTIRVVLGIGLVTVGFLLTGITSIILWIFGAILIITGAIGFCGLYVLFGINTCPVNKR